MTFLRLLLLLLLAAVLSGCADLWMWNYRRQGGFYEDANAAR